MFVIHSALYLLLIDRIQTNSQMSNSQTPNNEAIRSNVKQRSAFGVGALSISFGIYQLGMGLRQRNLQRVEAGVEAVGGGLLILKSGDGVRWGEIGGQVGAIIDIWSKTRQMRGSGGRKQGGLGSRQQKPGDKD